MLARRAISWWSTQVSRLCAILLDFTLHSVCFGIPTGCCVSPMLCVTQPTRLPVLVKHMCSDLARAAREHNLQALLFISQDSELCENAELLSQAI